MKTAFFLLLLFVQDPQDLESENLTLKSKIRELERKLAAAEDAGFYFSENGYSSILDVIKDLPDELEVPRRRLWDDGERQQVNAELKSLCIGVPFSSRHKISVSSKQNLAYSRDHTAPKYVITISFKENWFPYRGKRFVQKLSPIVIKGDDDKLKELKRLSGRSVDVDGVASTLTMTTQPSPFRQSRGDYSFTLTLIQKTFSPDLPID